MRIFAAIALALAGPVPLHAATVQADFEAASAALDAKNFAVARDGFTALLARIDPAKRSAALVRARLGAALVALGEAQAAVPLLTAAAASFKADTPEDRNERVQTLIDLGRARESLIEIDAARAAYQSGLALWIGAPGDPTTLALHLAIARTALFTDPALARASLDAVGAAAPADWLGKSDRAGELWSLRGRIELNQGNLPAARELYLKALNAAGGLSLKGSVADVRIRSDLGLVYARLGDKENVRKYLAYAGSGSIFREGFDSGADLRLPPCSPATALQPDDMAVIEIALRADGRVGGVSTIYATRSGGPDTLFAKAARDWSWQPAIAARMEPFWRAALRFEVRCVNDGPGTDEVWRPLGPLIDRWYAALGIVQTPDRSGTAAAQLPGMLAELARREAAMGPDASALIPVLLDLARNPAVEHDRQRLLHARLTTLLDKHDAPADLRVYVALLAPWPDSARGGVMRRAVIERGRLVAILASSYAAVPSRGILHVRVQLAQALETQRDFVSARSQLAAVIGAPEALLPAGDPVRVQALLRLASLEAADRQTAKADALLAQTGLSPAQCAAVAVTPSPVNARFTSKDFPSEVLRWGFEGSVKLAFDIDAAGAATNVRTILAIPPLVFSASTEKTIGKFRYRPIYRGTNAIGCTGNVERVKFLQPRAGA